jgi:hypothetical protein
MSEVQAYFWALFKRYPIRAIRLYFQRRKVRKAVRRALDQMFEETVYGPIIMRAPGETDAELRERMRQNLQQNILRELS